MQLTLLSGGAAQGLVAALAAKFKAETGCDITGTFGAVGAMRDKLIAGAPADLLILTQALIAELAGLPGASRISSLREYRPHIDGDTPGRHRCEARRRLVVRAGLQARWNRGHERRFLHRFSNVRT